MADRSVKHPRGIIEDMLVKVDKFIFPVDFVVLDMEKDKNIPIILGRPFLATERALIDVQKGEMSLRVQEEEVTFNVFKSLKFPDASDSCFSVEVIEDLAGKSNSLIKAMLERILADEKAEIEPLEEEQIANYPREVQGDPSTSCSRSLWGIDFMGPFPSSRGNEYILVAVDYVSK